MQRAAKEQGASTIALVNDEDSPLARDADALLPLHAGDERSVAATKSMIASLVAGASLVAHWSEDSELLAALARLPSILDVSSAAPPLGGGGRDAGQSRFALCRRSRRDLRRRRRGGAQAQGDLGHSRRGVLFRRSAAWAGRDHRAGISGARLRARARRRRPRGVFRRARPARLVRRRAARSSIASRTRAGRRVVALDGGHPLLTPIVALHAFYRVAEATARRRGRDPDQPPHLRKVTETL